MPLTQGSRPHPNRPESRTHCDVSRPLHDGPNTHTRCRRLIVTRAIAGFLFAVLLLGSFTGYGRCINAGRRERTIEILTARSARVGIMTGLRTWAESLRRRCPSPSLRMAGPLIRTPSEPKARNPSLWNALQRLRIVGVEAWCSSG